MVDDYYDEVDDEAEKVTAPCPVCQTLTSTYARDLIIRPHMALCLRCLSKFLARRWKELFG